MAKVSKNMMSNKMLFKSGTSRSYQKRPFCALNTSDSNKKINKKCSTNLYLLLGYCLHLLSFSSLLRSHTYSCMCEHIYIYLLLFLSLTCPPGSRIWPFFSQVSRGSGSPCAWQVKMAVVPTGRVMDCGG